jgi:integrase
LVFTAPEGGMIRRTMFRRRVFIPALRLAGTSGRVRIHDLRHTEAALAIEAGVHPKQIQAMLGRKNRDRHGHLRPAVESPAVNAAEALDESYRAADGQS